MFEIDEKYLSEYKRIMKKEYNYEPDDKEAREGANNLLNFLTFFME